MSERRDIFGWNGSRQIAHVGDHARAERLALPALGHEQLVAPGWSGRRGQLAELPQPGGRRGSYVICTAARSQGRTDRSG